MTKTVLGIRGVTKRFGAVTAVDRVSLDIRENEFFALLGASGSGKTTLLRLLGGFETPEEGQILLDGTDIAPLPPNRRPVNLMFQSYALFPHMSVARNVAYGLEMDGLRGREVADRVGAMLDTVQLGPLADRRPEQLSGGQRQRVALARALVKRPRVLLLDEPLGALDKKLRSTMQIELKRLQAEVGTTFVVVTHDQEEALVMADRIAILKDGALLQCDTPHRVYEHPETRFAADFIGVMNFLPGTATGRGAALDCGAGVAAPGGPAAGSRVVAAVRPERITLVAPDAAEGPENRLAGRIEALAYHGLDLQLHVRVAGLDHPVQVRVTAGEAEGAGLAAGGAVALGWHAAHTRIFEDHE